MPSPTPKLLDDWVALDEFALDLKRHPRSVDRWTKLPNGLPYAKLGCKKIIHIPTARTWLLGRMRNPNRRRNAEHAA
jgi:hypothetical protein